MSAWIRCEAQWFRTLNAFAEPLVRMGWGSPGLIPTGLITLETIGRRTARPHRTPVVATELGDHLLVGTVRAGRSDWIKNIRRTPEVRYWLRGRAHEATALLFAPGSDPPDVEHLPPAVRRIATNLQPAVGGLGQVAFAILVPQR